MQWFGPEDMAVFLGDYADRGAEGMEVISEVRSILDDHPGRIIALKGNHEDYSDEGIPNFGPCTLVDEAEQKLGEWERYWEQLCGFFRRLHLAALLPGLCLFVHGGLSGRIESAEDLVRPSREQELDVLWSDPGRAEGEAPNMRGIGVVFGSDVTRRVLEGMDASCLIRSHEPQKALSGPVLDHDGRVVTLSSTTVYGGAPFVLKLDPKNFPRTRQEIEDAVILL
jgi:diadenosine tetraphosphatase ApaH/serine/threonine PP2A family protein phosphatase